MAIREIRIFPDPALRAKAGEVTAFDDTLRALAADLLETMYASNGVGLAAPQVGVPLRVLAIDVADPETERRRPVVLVNPVITSSDGELTWNEGCLSFPGIYVEVTRAARVTVEARDPSGRRRTVEGEGLLAVALQHEIAHLDGDLIYDHMSFIRKRLVRRDLQKAREERQGKAAQERGTP